jgi:hypothetical protein
VTMIIDGPKPNAGRWTDYLGETPARPDHPRCIGRLSTFKPLWKTIPLRSIGAKHASKVSATTLCTGLRKPLMAGVLPGVGCSPKQNSGNRARREPVGMTPAATLANTSSPRFTFTRVAFAFRLARSVAGDQLVS